jgi:hypothetical protein
MKQSDPGKSQRDKFLTTARELGCDESDERFDAALGKLVKHKPANTGGTNSAPPVQSSDEQKGKDR